MNIFILAILAWGISFVIASMQSASSAAKTKPSRLMSFAVNINTQSALAIIVQFAQEAGYKISFIDKRSGRIVLEEPTSLTDYGFFFPVFLTQESSESTLVEVGIRSKLFQVGSLVYRSHENCVNGMKVAFLSQVE